jgi:hypothetical protein
MKSYDQTRIRRVENAVIEYSRIKESLFLPDQIECLEGVLMATPEKAMLDTLYLRRRIPFADELALDALSTGRLRSIANHYPDVVGQRMAAMLQMREKA